MTLMEDYRKNKDGDETDLEPDEKDETALEIKGKNPLAAEESVEEDPNEGAD